MERELQQFCNIPQVGGAFVCDNRGDVIVCSDPAVLATVAMNAIGREVGRSLLALEAGGRRDLRIEFVFDSWRLLVQDMGEAVVFVVCEPGVDVATVRMTTDVAINGWQKDARTRKRLAGRRVERNQLVTPATLDQPAYRAWKLIQSETP